MNELNEQHPPETGPKIAFAIDRTMSAVILWAWALVLFMQLPDNRLYHVWRIVCRYLESIGGQPIGV